MRGAGRVGARAPDAPAQPAHREAQLATRAAALDRGVVQPALPRSTCSSRARSLQLHGEVRPGAAGALELAVKTHEIVADAGRRGRPHRRPRPGLRRDQDALDAGAAGAAWPSTCTGSTRSPSRCPAWLRVARRLPLRRDALARAARPARPGRAARSPSAGSPTRSSCSCSSRCSAAGAARRRARRAHPLGRRRESSCAATATRSVPADGRPAAGRSGRSTPTCAASRPMHRLLLGRRRLGQDRGRRCTRSCAPSRPAGRAR